MPMGKHARPHAAWASFRFAVVGPLLACPPERRGELKQAITHLSGQTYTHPVTGEPVRFAASTIERWYYRARAAPQDPVAALRNRVRRDVGANTLSALLCQAIATQYEGHPSWSVQLHYDNLEQLLLAEPEIGALPSYTTLRRYMKQMGMRRQKPGPRHPTAGQILARERLLRREVRSYEAEYVHSLWHLDFHEASRKVLTKTGEYMRPKMLGVLDDHSRLACHVQWYLSESAETLCHGLSQAILKRGLPRSLMTDNGSAMLAGETVSGLERLGIVHATTLPYSAYQNAKQEHFWLNVENRLLAMLEGEQELDLLRLNHVTQAWVEGDYNQRPHRELGCSPIRRLLEAKNVGREVPGPETVRRAFRCEASRRQRRSDGTISIEGTRFEVPSRYGQLETVHIRYARWDLRIVDLVDQNTGQVLCPLYPLDKARNAEAGRRTLDPAPGPGQSERAQKPEMPPLLRKLMEDYSATGMPPAYLLLEDQTQDDPEDPS